jgi:hypothetical protein
MTAAQFVEFLNRTQRDPRLNEILYPYANTSRAKDLIQQYEPNKYNAQRGICSHICFKSLCCHHVTKKLVLWWQNPWSVWFHCLQKEWKVPCWTTLTDSCCSCVGLSVYFVFFYVLLYCMVYNTNNTSIFLCPVASITVCQLLTHISPSRGYH